MGKHEYDQYIYQRKIQLLQKKIDDLNKQIINLNREIGVLKDNLKYYQELFDKFN